MYRVLIAFLCVSAVRSAPQKDSDVTYIKLQTEPEPTANQPLKPNRESRIDILPLTIPSTESEDKPVVKRNEVKKDNHTYNYSDRIYSIKTKPKKQNRTTTPRTTPTITISTTEFSSPSTTTTTEKAIPPITEQTTAEQVEVININTTDIIPAESSHNSIVSDTQFDTEITLSDELITEKYVDQPTETTVFEEETTKAPIPKLLPKLSHFGKSSFDSFSHNLIGISGKRRFRSRCRCEKIWNCAKLQISVPRCPEEYFLCCS